MLRALFLAALLACAPLARPQAGGGKEANCGNKAGDPCCPSQAGSVGSCTGGNLVCGNNDKCAVCGADNAPCCAGGDPCPGDSLVCSDSVCAACGADKGPCCAGGDPCPGDNLVCSDSVCVACGVDKGPCCAGGDPCPGDSLVCSDSVCAACGADKGPCCAGGDPCPGDNLVCTDSVCAACGADKGPCCAGGDPCPGDDLVCSDSVCAACGTDGQPCCKSDSGGACSDSSLVCNSGSNVCRSLETSNIPGVRALGTLTCEDFPAKSDGAQQGARQLECDVEGVMPRTLSAREVNKATCELREEAGSGKFMNNEEVELANVSTTCDMLSAMCADVMRVCRFDRVPSASGQLICGDASKREDAIKNECELEPAQLPSKPPFRGVIRDELQQCDAPPNVGAGTFTDNTGFVLNDLGEDVKCIQLEATCGPNTESCLFVRQAESDVAKGSGSSCDDGCIAGSVIGALVAVAAAIAAFLFFRRRGTGGAPAKAAAAGGTRGTPVRIVGSRLSATIIDDFWGKLHSHLTSDGSEWCLARPGAAAQSVIVLHYLQPEDRGADPYALRDEALAARVDAAGAPPHVAFVQSWNPASTEPPRPSTRVFNAAGYQTVQGGAYGGRCHDVYMWDGTLQHKRLQAINSGPFKLLAQDVVQQVRAAKNGSPV